MIDNYVINDKTLVIMPIKDKITKIIEKDNIYFIKKSVINIIKKSCFHYGNSYEGRKNTSDMLIGVNYKQPIMIDNYAKLIFFPTSSIRNKDCFWISLNNMESFNKNNVYSEVKLKENIKICLEISYFSLKNQIYRATYLETLLKDRINTVF